LLGIKSNYSLVLSVLKFRALLPQNLLRSVTCNTDSFATTTNVCPQQMNSKANGKR
jgi:hypothetical protein